MLFGHSSESFGSFLAKISGKSSLRWKSTSAITNLRTYGENPSWFLRIYLSKKYSIDKKLEISEPGIFCARFIKDSVYWFVTSFWQALEIKPLCVMSTLNRPFSKAIGSILNVFDVSWISGSELYFSTVRLIIQCQWLSLPEQTVVTGIDRSWIKLVQFIHLCDGSNLLRFWGKSIRSYNTREFVWVPSDIESAHTAPKTPYCVDTTRYRLIPMTTISHDLLWET